MARHELPLERRHLHGHFSRELEPVVTIDPGDSVRLSVPNAGWRLESGEPFEPRDDELDSGHALAGPIEVRGARAGQTLAVTIDDVRPGSWGITFTEPPHFVRWELADGVGRSERFDVELRPFLGVLGMPPPEPGVHSTIPPRRWGGNIDCKELVAGTTLFLPIPVDGALFSAGDGHAAQGDGEVSGTAIECPAQADAHAGRPRRPAARVAGRAHRRRVDHVRVRRGSRPRGTDRNRRHARPASCGSAGSPATTPSRWRAWSSTFA